MNVGLQLLKDNVRRSSRSKFITYITLNPELNVHPIYHISVNVDIPEYKRMIFTRLRVSAHNLKIETGRWSRTPRDSRLCECGEIQTECHILCSCPLTDLCRASCDAIHLFECPSLFDAPVHALIDYVYECYTTIV